MSILETKQLIRSREISKFWCVIKIRIGYYWFRDNREIQKRIKQKIKSVDSGYRDLAIFSSTIRLFVKRL